MPPQKRAEEYKCQRCGKVYTSMMRLLHHQAADHAPKTLKDIRTMKNIPHSTGASNAVRKTGVLSSLDGGDTARRKLWEI